MAVIKKKYKALSRN